MGVPKGRRTKSKQGHRRSHLGLEKKQFAKCSHCGTSVLPHQVCGNCGYYKGVKVIDVLARLKKRERKDKERSLAEAQEKESQSN